MISDMSPGDKLSLKGKLFELSKKLSIIDFESKRENQYSFKPDILPLPERDETMVDSLRKAEIIRKQRKELLHQSVITNSLEGCTFSPQFVSNSLSRPSVRNDTRPAHERLTQKGKEYREKKANMQTSLKKGYDFDGNKLFVPQLNERLPGGAWVHGSGRGTGNGPPSSDDIGDRTPDVSMYSSVGPRSNRKLQQQQSHSPKAKVVNTMAADEFLYQDAKDREERHRMRSLDAVVEAESYASTVKTNKRSYDVLKKKAERDLDLVFKYLVNCDKNQSDTKVPDCVSLDSVKGGSLLLLRSGLLEKNVTQTVFQLLDYQKSGSVSWSTFFTICLPLVFHQKMNAALVDIKQTFSVLSSSFSGGSSHETFTASSEDLQTLKDWLSHLITALSPTPTHSIVEVESHQPKPNKISHKLAARKAEKDKRQFKEIVKARTENEESNIILSLDESVVSESNAEAARNHVTEYNELLSIREKLALERRKQLEEQVLAERMTECTFKPKMPKAVIRKNSASTNKAELNRSTSSLPSDIQNLLDNSDLSSGPATVTSAAVAAGAVGDENKPQEGVTETKPAATTSKNVFKKLYNQKVAHQTAAADTSSYIVEELKYCTFQPRLAPRKTLAVSNKPIEGFDKSVSRIRHVHEEKIKQKEAEAVQYLEDDLRYKKSRVVAQQGSKPFHFSLQDRRATQQQQHWETDNAPKLIIEVKLSATKSAKISIGATDIPEELAARFARIYTLEPAMTGVLTEVIKQSMIQNGLLEPVDEEDDGSSSNSEGEEDASTNSGGEGGGGEGEGAERDSDENSDEGDSGSGGEDSEYDEESLRDVEEDPSLLDAVVDVAHSGVDDSSHALELSARSNDSQDDNDQLEMLLMSAHSNISGGAGSGASGGGGLGSRAGSFNMASPMFSGSMFNHY